MKKNIFKKIITLTYLAFILFGFLAPIYFSEAISAYDQCVIDAVNNGGDASQCNSLSATPTTNYNLLAPLPNPDGETLTTFDPTQENNLSAYLNLMIKIFIGICAVLAVVMIFMGGIQYMTSELPGEKGDGKGKIVNAIFGLILALGAWTLLYTINPKLLDSSLSSLKDVTITVELGGEGTRELNTATIKNDLTNVGIICPRDGGPNALSGIAKSYVGNSSYSQQDRNTVKGGKAMIDCSSYVSQVYVCAGLSNPGGTSTGIFGSGSTVATSVSSDGTKVNGVPLKAGDLIGWTPQGGKAGHVMMYIGDGKMIDAQGQGGVAVRPVSSYAGRIKYVKTL
ncbi:MAG: NlpC/P60 family protein [Candidatus Paceibacterota bacterium]|jgi:hypothetical protein